METGIYIMIPDKQGVQHLWNVIGETNTGKCYIIQSRSTVRYISKKKVFIVPGSNVLKGEDRINVKDSDIDINYHSNKEYINQMCFNCDNREGVYCKVKGICVLDVDYSDCWFDSNADNSIDLGYLEPDYNEEYDLIHIESIIK